MPFRSLQLPVFWDPDLERPRPGEAIASFRPGWPWNLVLLLLIFSIHVAGETGPPSSPSSSQLGQGQPAWCLQEEAGAPELRGSSECEQCLLLPVWPQTAPPMLLGADCCPWLQGLINSGPRRFEITG